MPSQRGPAVNRKPTKKKGMKPALNTRPCTTVEGRPQGKVR
jgi:hypothetical protein